MVLSSLTKTTAVTEIFETIDAATAAPYELTATSVEALTDSAMFSTVDPLTTAACAFSIVAAEIKVDRVVTRLTPVALASTTTALATAVLHCDVQPLDAGRPG